MRIRMYGGVRGRKTKVGGKSTFVFLLLDIYVCVNELSAAPLSYQMPLITSHICSYWRSILWRSLY